MDKNLIKLEIAKAEDSLALSQFFKQFSIRGLVEYKIDRQKDYFAALDIQSDKHVTYVLRHQTTQDKETSQIDGVASFTVKDVLINEEITRIAFGRDLRILPSRSAMLEWTKNFLPVLEEVRQTFGVKHIFAVLNTSSNNQAENIFLRPRNLNRPLPNYFPYRRFNLVSLHGRFPWASNPLPHLKIRHGHANNVDALIHYICKKSRERNLSTVWDSISFYDKLESWKNLKLEDFLIAFDKNLNVVGCVAPWSSGGIQDFIPMHYSLRAHNFRQFLKFGKVLGWTRTLTKPYSRIHMEDSLNFKYLNFLSAENGDIFESLIWKAYDDAEESQFLVYNQMRSDFIYRSPYNWISAKQPFGVFLMQSPHQVTPDFLHPTNERSIEIEPFFDL